MACRSGPPRRSHVVEEGTAGATVTPEVQHAVPIDTMVRRFARPLPQRRPDASDRTIRGPEKAIEAYVARGHTAPMTIPGDAVLAAGRRRSTSTTRA